jgi:hypothetical protein
VPAAGDDAVAREHPAGEEFDPPAGLAADDHRHLVVLRPGVGVRFFDQHEPLGPLAQHRGAGNGRAARPGREQRGTDRLSARDRREPRPRGELGHLDQLGPAGHPGAELRPVPGVVRQLGPRGRHPGRRVERGRRRAHRGAEHLARVRVQPHLDRLPGRHMPQVLFEHLQPHPHGREIDHLGERLGRLDHLAGGEVGADDRSGHRGRDRQRQPRQGGPAADQLVEPRRGQPEAEPPGAGKVERVAAPGHPRPRVGERLSRHHIGRRGQPGEQLLGHRDAVLCCERLRLKGIQFQAFDLGEHVAGCDDLPGRDRDPHHRPGSRAVANPWFAHGATTDA